MKDRNKNGLFVWKTTGDPNFSLIAFFIGYIFDSKVGKILLASDRRGFWPIFGNIQRVIIFKPYKNQNWNFQDSIFFIKESYDLSFNKIWGVTRGTIWWFDMEWPMLKCKIMKDWAILTMTQTLQESKIK